MKIRCDDPALRKVWENVVGRINERMSDILGEPFDLLESLSSQGPLIAATLQEAIFEEGVPDNPSAVGCTSIRRGASITEPSEAEGRIVFSIRQLRELSDVAQRGVIAHELGHAWDQAHSGDYFAQTGEEEADEYAIEWGFSEEIRQMYLELHGEKLLH